MNYYEENMVYNDWMPKEFDISNSTLLSYFLNTDNNIIGIVGLITIVSCILPLLVMFLSYMKYTNKGLWLSFLAEFFVGFILYIFSVNNNFTKPLEVWFAIRQFVLFLVLLCLIAIIIFSIKQYYKKKTILFYTSLASIVILPTAGFFSTAYLSIYNFSQLLSIDLAPFFLMAIIILMLIIILFINKTFPTLFKNIKIIKKEKSSYITVYKSILISLPFSIALISLIFLFLPILNNSKLCLYQSTDSFTYKYNIMLLPYEKSNENNGTYADSYYEYHSFYTYDMFRQIIEYKKYNYKNKITEYGSIYCNDRNKRCEMVYEKSSRDFVVRYINYGKKSNNIIAECKYDNAIIDDRQTNNKNTYILDTLYEYYSYPYLTPNSPIPEFVYYCKPQPEEDGSFSPLYRKYTHYHWWEDYKTLDEYITWREENNFEIIKSEYATYTNYGHISKKYISYEDSPYEEVLTYSEDYSNKVIKHEKVLKSNK